ncbi:protein crumbs homolog 1 isoform X4 [Chiloscyllium punctatum]|uniref:protein crumbs homolog 1 isoform X4 n=1 Tax=Chiloscyllium punctatum TaxID=137246 RepID=UPI003B633E97
MMAFCNTSRGNKKPARPLCLLLFIAAQCLYSTANLNKCLSKLCENNATCEPHSKTYVCYCPDAPVPFTGKNCKELYDVCTSYSCLHNATCNSVLGTVDFSCDCPPGQIGPSCETYLGKCANTSCMNGAICLDEAAGSSCVCPPGYTGANCETNVNECASSPCENGAVCKDKIDGFLCFCVPGYQGRRCEIEVDECASEPCRNEARCMNEIDKYICACPPGLTGINCELEINECLSQPCLNEATCHDHFASYSCTCAPGFKGRDCEINLDECASQPCQNGGQCTDKVNGYSCDCVNSQFTGVHCDIYVPACLSHPCLNNATCQDNIGNYTCHCWTGFTGTHCEIDIHECFSNPCLHGGECIELSWKNMYGIGPELPAVFSYEHAAGYICKCQRGFTELISGRFGHQDSKGYAMFIIDDNPGEEVEISMFIRTQKPNGLLLVLKHSHTPYLQIGLDTGKIVVQTHLSKPLIGGHFTPDSPFHLITVKIKNNSLELVQDGQVVGHTHILPIRVQAGDALFVGGLPDRLESAHDRRNFKGCIQDLKMNNKRLEFYPIGVSEDSYSNRTLVNVTVGCNDDNACKLNLCLNGGTCSSIWDDFVCKCPPNISGKTCNWVKWCQLNPCPLYTECELLTDGFDCLVNATFTGRKSDLAFRGNGKIKRELTNITFSFRTRDSNAVILHAEKEQDFITIAIQQCHLIFTMQSGNSLGNLSILSSRAISDGFWHDVTLYIIDPFLQYSRWQMVIDKKEEMVTSTVISGNLNFLLEGTDIYLGSGGPKKGGSLAGCLNTLKLGGISLPYFANDNMHIIQPQQEQFIKISSSPVIMGCPTKNICVSNPCKNNGSCEDMVSYYHCNCAAGWTGLNCDVNINECESGPCIHGNCTDKVSAYKCTCKSGFKGTNCEINIDNCWKHKCANGATCIDSINSYTCSCPDNFTGRFCEYPRLSATFCTEEKKNWTCYNGGNCTNGKTTRCTCPIGFTGNKCEVDIDECESDPCLNGGFCQNLPNRFHCICDMSFAGDRCEFDTTPPPNKVNIAAIVAPCVIGGVIVLAVILTFLILKVREKRQTEGNYSPSSQEQTGSRMEMNNTLKLPPEERLI